MKMKRWKVIHTAVPTMSLVFYMWFLLFFLVWELLEGRCQWVSIPGLSTALALRQMVSKFRVNLIAKQKTHAADGDFDWLLVLTHVVTLSNSEDVFFPEVCRNSLPAGANHLTH